MCCVSFIMFLFFVAQIYESIASKIFCIKCSSQKSLHKHNVDTLPISVYLPCRMLTGSVCFSVLENPTALTRNHRQSCVWPMCISIDLSMYEWKRIEMPTKPPTHRHVPSFFPVKHTFGPAYLCLTHCRQTISTNNHPAT